MGGTAGRRDTLALTGIVLVHALAVLSSLSVSRPTQTRPTVRTVTIADVTSEVPNVPEPSVTALPVNMDVAAPLIEVVVSQAQATATPIEDPYAGAAVPLRRVSAADGLQAGQSNGAAAFDLGWVETIERRFPDRLTQLGSSIGPVVIEVFSLPWGGFSDARLIAGCGASEIDQAVLAEVRLHPSLVPPGTVSVAAWTRLPPIILRAST